MCITLADADAIIASARALIGVDELHARTERYSGPMKRVNPEEDEI